MLQSGDRDEDEADAGEAPLDPAVERVRARLARLMLISAATTIIGFGAVAFAVVYRLSPPADSAAPAITEAAPAPAGLPDRLSVAVPAGYRVTGASASGGELVLLARPAAGGAALVLVVDRTSGALLQRVELDETDGADAVPGG